MCRKITDGKIRNKERTKLKLIRAVGEVIRTQGYTKLGVNNIAHTAEVSKKMIYQYFYSVDNLISIYIQGKDYWTAFSNEVDDLLNANHDIKQLIPVLLENLLENLVKEVETQKILLWEISEPSKLMREISKIREEFGAGLLAHLDPIFEKTNIEIRSVCALLLGGIYYLVLHSNGAGGTFCEIDIKTDKGKNQIIKGIQDILSWTYLEAKRQQS
ncbi:TetR/AcrR family transcriptional regulator [Sphingobacterium deserti]|uniref:Regulatory protein TetR n=1 Tax=Sphingobacterium deserti TaxID=1229276 RepID=A0A0B8T3E1_9SPHI|nr:TetR/AcrR family transcriptional regulator [Sphingobacterium deserti]KGE15616.1 regulatory protein TetR [Sphingobacterium deserti]